jgi:hypothetical protein
LHPYLQQTYHFHTQIHPEVCEFINLFSVYACSPIRFSTVRARWKTAFKFCLNFRCNGINLSLTATFALLRYGVVKTPGDMEMRPLESDDDDDDEDVTMFNRKN